MGKNGLKKLISKAVNDAAEKIKPKKVILFGSYAYGKPARDSDVDLLFIKNTSLSKMERYRLVNEHLEHFMPMDILIKTPAEINKRLRMGDPFYKEIIRKGRILYDASK
jgi:predicted nucleotidyltransferase